MLKGIQSLLASEKAIAAGVLAICATALVAIGAMTVADWQLYTRDVLIVYVSGKTVQGAVSTWATAKIAPQVKVETKTENKTENKTTEITTDAA